MDLSNVGPRSHVSSPWPHLIPRHKFVNLFPKWGWHPFLYKLSYLIYYLTLLFHLLWNLISSYLRQICWHLFYYGRGPPIHNLYREEPWDCGVILSLSRAVGNKSTQEQSLSKIHLESVSLSVRMVSSTISELWGLYVVCNFHLMFKVLLTCYTKSATKSGPLSDPMLVGNPNLGTISLSRHPGYVWCSFSPGRKSFYPF